MFLQYTSNFGRVQPIYVFVAHKEELKSLSHVSKVLLVLLQLSNFLVSLFPLLDRILIEPVEVRNSLLMLPVLSNITTYEQQVRTATPFSQLP